MSIFKLVKAAVTTRQAAEFYGLHVNSNGMVCCPFHQDRHPSMKVDDRYYCFGCHETGDVIDFVGQLFHLAPYEAAQKIAADFGIDPSTPEGVSMLVPEHWEHLEHGAQKYEDQRKREIECGRIMIQYECYLKQWKEQYAPKTYDAPWHPRFVEAIKRLSYVGYVIDELYSADPVSREQMTDDLINDGSIERISAWLNDHRNEKENDTIEQHEESRAA